MHKTKGLIMYKTKKEWIENLYNTYQLPTEFLEELIKNGLIELRTDFESLKLANESSTQENLSIFAHKVKSSSLFLTLQEISMHAASLEEGLALKEKERTGKIIIIDNKLRAYENIFFVTD